VTQSQEYFLWIFFKRLREWHFPLAPDDYQALHDALSAGFGWKSRADLRALCGALWAKSRQEQEILFSLFDRLVEEFGWEDWRLPQAPGATEKPQPMRDGVVPSPESASANSTDNGTRPQETETRPTGEAPELRPQEETRGISVNVLLRDLDRYSQAHLILSPRYTLSYRQVAQAWRRLRRFVRSGPQAELDIEATVNLRCRQGVVSPVVLRASQRNAVRLLLLLDRQGSMVPFHHFSDNAVRSAIYQSSRFERAETFYFHDVPSGRRNAEHTKLLQELSRRLFPAIDDEVGKINPLQGGYVYQDPRLLQARPLSEVLAAPMEGAAIVIVSDAGAARANYDVERLVDTVAFLRALYAHTPYVVWLNPLPKERWTHSSAAQIARFVPMLPVTRAGLHKAVNVLRGQSIDLEYPL
jgi:uncharacterized protein with von Willebrand factor type A (vWA) domain